MSRVEWTRFSGEEVEATVALFISAIYPRAERITPSRGDGGIDVLVQNPDANLVYQVKKYTSPLTARQKAEVERSVDALVNDSRLQGLVVDEWHLVMPWDPTLEARQWLNSYVLGRGLPAPIWDGLTRCDLWAAQYPQVVDYYLDGGRERITKAAAELINGLRFKDVSLAEAEQLNASGIAGSLRATVEYLNREDPLFSYRIEVAPGPGPDLAAEFTAGTLSAPPGCVLRASWQDSDHHGCVDVYAKSRVALDLSPITGAFQLTAKRGSSQAQALEDFRRFGTPMAGISLGPSELVAPGGLSGSFQSGTAWVGPAERTEDQELSRLVARGPDGSEITSLIVGRRHTMSGLPVDGQVPGVELMYEDDARTIQATVRIDFEGKSTNLRLTVPDPSERLVVDVLPTLELVAAMKPPNSLVIAPRFGPLPKSATTIPEDFMTHADWWVETAQSLSAIQHHTPVPIRMPNFSTLTEDEDEELWMTGQLCRGVVVHTSASHFGSAHIEDVRSSGRFFRITPWRYTYAGHDIDLGHLIDSFNAELIERAVDSESGSVDLWRVVDERIDRQRATEDEVALAPELMTWILCPTADIEHPAN